MTSGFNKNNILINLYRHINGGVAAGGDLRPVQGGVAAGGDLRPVQGGVAAGGG